MDSESTFENNLLCNSLDQYTPSSLNSTFRATVEGPTNKVYGSAVDAGYTEELIVNYDLFTSSPRQIVLPHAKKPSAVSTTI